MAGKRWGLIGMLMLLAACGVPTEASVVEVGGADNQQDQNPPPPNPKWFVCKYVDKPGEPERLQTGQNPISVSENAFPAGVVPAVGVTFNDAQGRSVIIAEDVGQAEPGVDQCPPVTPPTTTTTSTSTTTSTTSSTTSTTSSTTSTTSSTSTTSTTLPPRPSLFAVNVAAVCVDGAAAISITFGDRPDLDGGIGELSIISLPNGLTVLFRQLQFQAGETVTIPYPPVAAGTTSSTLNYNLSGEFATASVGPPPTDCVESTTTTTTTAVTTSTTTLPPTTTTTPPTSTTGPTTTTTPGTTSTLPGQTTTTSTIPGTTTTTTPPPPFTFGAAATVCVAEVPTIRIVFQNTFPELAGQVGTLTMTALDGEGTLVGLQELTYIPGATVDILYPGTSVNPDGSIADVPGWILQPNGLWVRDPSDEFLRLGILLTYTVNPTATAVVTYPPESATCANPENPPPTTPTELPPTGIDDAGTLAAIASLLLAAGLGTWAVGRRRRTT